MSYLESPETINKRLIDQFGIDTHSSNPIWRVVFSDDQMEKRLTNFTKEGFELLTPMVIEVPKYKQWIQGKYILERFVIVPDFQQIELAGAKTSYEIIWTFEDKNGNPLPPKWEAINFIINTIYAAQYGTHNLKKFHDPENSQEAALEAKRQRVDAIIEELWGDQSSLQGTTKTGESVAYTGPSVFEKEGVK